ncbi:NEW3 domain-containing protein [Chloroflexota bacterium]
MSKIRAVRYLLSVVFLFTMLGGLIGVPVLAVQENDSGALQLPPNQDEPAAEEEPVAISEPDAEEEDIFEDVVYLKVNYPVATGESGKEFEFEVEVLWMGDERRRFDLSTSTLEGWDIKLYTAYGRVPEAKMAVMELEPRKFFGNKTNVVVKPLPGYLPEPGDYTFTFTAVSGDISNSVELTAKITAKYDFSVRTPTLRLNTDAIAGDDNYLTILLVNSGSAPVEDISLSSVRPDGWMVTYAPVRIDSLESGATREVSVNIIPPKNTIAGDWSVTLRARSEQASDDIAMRVTVLTPTIWGWVGILIVVIVAAGVGAIFWKLGRR